MKRFSFIDSIFFGIAIPLVVLGLPLGLAVIGGNGVIGLWEFILTGTSKSMTFYASILFGVPLLATAVVPFLISLLCPISQHEGLRKILWGLTPLFIYNVLTPWGFNEKIRPIMSPFESQFFSVTTTVFFLVAFWLLIEGIFNFEST